MNNLLKKSVVMALGAAAFVGSYTWDGPGGSISIGLVSPAEARVGRPLTPVSYAGVARRTTRRVVATTPVVAPRPVVVAPAPVVVVAPTPQTCVDTVNADGSITRTCH